MRTYDPEQPLVSFHIPKTAGTSLVTSLETWFPDGRLLLHRTSGSGDLPQLFDFSGPICIHGHFNTPRNFGIQNYYPQAQQFITFFRDPFDRFLSGWFYARKGYREGARDRFHELVGSFDDFGDFLKAMAERDQRPRFPGEMHFLVQADDLHGLKRRLHDEFVFIGLTSRYEASVKGLAKALGKPPAPASHLNATERDGRSLDRWRAFHQERFPLSYELYDYVVSLNEECLSRYS